MENVILPGIKKIEYCLARTLTFNSEHCFQEGDTVEPIAEFNDMCISGLAKCEINESFSEGESLYDTKITFFTSHIQTAGQLFCYRLTSVNGEKYLLGTNKRPFVLCTSKRVLPDQQTQKQGYEVTLSYKNKHSILLIS